MLAAGEYGGLESVVELLTQGQADAGAKVSVVLLLEQGAGSHAFEDLLRAAGQSVYSIRVGARAYAAQQSELRRILREIRPQVVHGHGYQADIHLALAAPASKLPSVSTVHGFTGGNWKLRLYEALHLRALRRIERVVAVSAPIVERVVAAGTRPGNVRLIQNAWSPQGNRLSRAAARRELGVPAESRDRLVGWVGRLSHEKGPDQLIEALAEVGRTNVQVCFVGDGPEREALAQRAAGLGLVDRVHFAGARARAGRLFAAFDLYALSSRTEGTPMVLFEAASAGVPIVATRVGGVPDVLSETEAILVPPLDPRALALAIESIAEGGSDVAERASRARARIESEFATGPWLQRYEETYREILASR